MRILLCDICLLFKELIPGFLQFTGFTVKSFRAANYYANKDKGGYVKRLEIDFSVITIISREGKGLLSLNRANQEKLEEISQ